LKGSAINVIARIERIQRDPVAALPVLYLSTHTVKSLV
jgi:hypothetical protein